MKSNQDASQERWFRRNRMWLVTGGTLLGYAVFLQLAFGIPALARQLAAIGILPLVFALTLLILTYAVRCWRVADYFPKETHGQFRRLLKLTLVHNLLNIMLPLRSGEASFPLLMRSEFGMPLARATAALLVMRLLDLHALLAAAGIGLVLGQGSASWAVVLWLAFVLAPLPLFGLKGPILRLARRLPERLRLLVDEIERGLPAGPSAFLRAWGATLVNWGVKVVVLAWVLRLMDVTPLAASFGGALGGELSSVLPVHAPGGVGTYPAGIVAGALSFGAVSSTSSLAIIGKAAVNAHLLILISAFVGTGIAVLLAPSKRS
ncbi:MAG: lysylphosphatidylglycerol synthase domain-containing protein [Allorhizobium sp.]